MELVVDTNVLIASLVKDSMARKLLSNPEFELYAPEYLLSELIEHKKEIQDKSGLSDSEYKVLVAVVLSRVSVVPEETFGQHLKAAFKISPDPEDTPFIALCMSKNIPLWSNDKSLKKQSAVKIFTTDELLKLL